MTEVREAASGPMRTLDPAELSRQHRHGLINGLVSPRPIAWVSTVSASGATNVAPHSYATVACLDPLMLAFVSAGDKDTVRNIRESGGWVWNVVDFAHLEPMNLTSTPAPHEVSEFALAHLEEIASDHVAAPRVGSAAAAMECEHHSIIALGHDGGAPSSFLIIGRVLAIHAAERILDHRGNADLRELDPIGRIDANGYSFVRERTDLPRPTWPLV